TTASTVGIVTTIPNGVLVHSGSEGNGDSNGLLDMNPATDTSIWDWLVNAPLLAGQSFSDPAIGLTLTTASVTSGGATVSVQMNALAPASAPAVAISTDKTLYARGQTVSVTAGVSADGSPLPDAVVYFTIVKS